MAALASFLLIVGLVSFKFIFVSKDSKSASLISDFGEPERLLSFISISMPGPKLTLFLGAEPEDVSREGRLFNLIVPVSPTPDVDKLGSVGVILITSFIMIKQELLILSKTQIKYIFHFTIYI